MSKETKEPMKFSVMVAVLCSIFGGGAIMWWLALR